MSLADEKTLNEMLGSANDDHDRLMAHMDRARARMRAQMAAEEEERTRRQHAGETVVLQQTPQPPTMPNPLLSELPDRDNTETQPTVPDLPTDVLDTIVQRKRELAEQNNS